MLLECQTCNDPEDMTVRLVTLLLLCATIGVSHAEDLTQNTPCSKLVTAMDSHNQDQIHQAAVMILNIMDTLDNAHTERGEPGIMNQLSDQGEIDMAAMTSVHCREHRQMTIYNSAAYVYRGLRDLEVQFGTAK